jgi:hypothetical protein
MNGYSEMKVDLVAVDPLGFVFDIGDSPCVNGGGGDCGVYFNDAELDVQATLEGQVALRMYASDLIPRDTGSSVLATVDAFFAASGTSARTIYVRDKRVCIDDGSCVNSDALLRINAPESDSRFIDSYWYLGFNRVLWSLPDGTIRAGVGLRRVTLTLQ